MLIPKGDEDLQIAGKRAQVRSSILARGDWKKTMTTDNIDGIDSADSIIAELGRLAKAAEKRAEALAAERRGIEVRRRRAKRGLRVAERKFLDDEAVLDEEAIQLSWILRGDEADGDDESGDASSDSPVTPPTGPTPPEGRDPLPGPRTARARAEAEAEAAAEAGAEARATARADATATAGGTPTTPTPVVHVLDVRRWNWLQWLLAAIGLIVGLLIALATWSWVVDDVTGFARGLVAASWWVGLAMAGFFGGGFIGSRIEED